MRVVAGTARGLRLSAPAGGDVRPTLDRVREAVFNALGSLDVVSGAVVLDAFAGSGALGIEALSRGAASATFVDQERSAVESVRANLASTGLDERARIVRGDTLVLLRGGDRALLGPFDLVLADPPYAYPDWAELVGSLRPVMADGAVLVTESDRPLGPEVVTQVAAADGDILRERRYGGTVVTMITSQAQTHDPPVDADGPAERPR